MKLNKRCIQISPLVLRNRNITLTVHKDMALAARAAFCSFSMFLSVPIQVIGTKSNSAVEMTNCGTVCESLFEKWCAEFYCTIFYRTSAQRTLLSKTRIYTCARHEEVVL